MMCNWLKFFIGAVLALLPATLTLSAAVRVPNTTLRMPPMPPQSGFTTVPAFGSLTFTNPVALVTPPDETNRLFVVEQDGVVAVITNLVAPTRTEFLNIISRVSGGVPNDERGLLGLAFHPGYATNGFFYVYYSRSTLSTNLNGTVNNGGHQCVSRFTVSASNPNAANSSSELRLLTMYDEAGNHNGGCLQFGPDGYLYISTGDEGNQNDSLNNSQRIDKDLWSGILRVDVDQRPGSLLPTPHPAHRAENWNGVIHYRVPPDNPFVGATSFNGQSINTNALRTEFWAVGLRNPWRFSFDPLDGTLYCGDVGGSALEEINVIVRGGNYGWAYREGPLDGPKADQAPPGFTSIPPIVAYAHGSGTNQGNSVSGGVIYRGDRFPSLNGKYIFADYVSGRIWAARPDGTNAIPFQLLTTDTSVAGFGWDPRNGDVLIADQNEDTVKRFVTSTNLSGPRTLAATGAFADLATLTPQPGILPYEINVPFWSDNAHKSRWFSVPDTNLTLGFSAEGNWSFPTGTVWIKHFGLETNTLTHESRRLETRFLVRNTNGVYGLAYRWTTPPTNALLVAEEGLDELLVINDGGLLRTQVWHYPGRGECQACHTTAGGGAAGFDTVQLNREVLDGGLTVNQIQMLSDAGYFSTPVTGVGQLRSLAHPTNEFASLEWRVRSYLEANCSFCHQPAGTIGSWDGRFGTPTRLANLINGTLANTKDDPSNRVVAPGSPAHSMLLTRISTRGPGAMPPLASSLVDTTGVAVLTRWITADLTNYQSFTEWQAFWFGSTNAPEAAASADPDGDRADNASEYLAGTRPLDSTSVWRVSIEAGPTENEAFLSWLHLANRAVELLWTTNLSDATSWRPLDVPGNSPAYPATNQWRLWSVAPGGQPNTFFRARVSEL